MSSLKNISSYLSTGLLYGGAILLYGPILQLTIPNVATHQFITTFATLILGRTGALLCKEIANQLDLSKKNSRWLCRFVLIITDVITLFLPPYRAVKMTGIYSLQIGAPLLKGIAVQSIAYTVIKSTIATLQPYID